MKLLIDQDKANHVIYGYVFSFIVGAMYTLMMGQIFHPAWSVGIAFTIGLAKEIYDYAKNMTNKRKGLISTHSVDFLDVLYTTLGGVSLYLPTLMWH
jgi:hypothetical protein